MPNIAQAAEPVIVAVDLRSAKGRELLATWVGTDDAAVILADGRRYAAGLAIPGRETAQVCVTDNIGTVCREILRSVEMVRERQDAASIRFKLATLPPNVRVVVDALIDHLEAEETA